MGLRQTRTGGTPASGPDHDPDEDGVEVRQGGRKVKFKVRASELRPLGDSAPDRALPPEPERESE